MLEFDSKMLSVVLNIKKSINRRDCRGFDWQTARAEHKIRGVPVLIYNKEGNTRVLTARPSYGLEPVSKDEVMCFLASKYGRGREFVPFDFGSSVGRRYRWVFEYTRSSKITPHYDTDMILISSMTTGTAMEIGMHNLDRFAKSFEISRPRSDWVSSAKNVKNKVLNNLHPLDEGVIVVNAKAQRIKFPNPINKALRKFIYYKNAKLDDAATICLGGEDIVKEVVKYYPTMKNILIMISGALRVITTRANNHMYAFDDILNRKDFASHCAGVDPQRLMFALFSREVNDFYDAMQLIKSKEVVAETVKRYYLVDLQKAMEDANWGIKDDLKTNTEI